MSPICLDCRLSPSICAAHAATDNQNTSDDPEMEVITLRRERDQAIAVLKAIEWEDCDGCDNAQGKGYCPSCGGSYPHPGIDPRDYVTGHKPGCALAAVLDGAQ